MKNKLCKLMFILCLFSVFGETGKCSADKNKENPENLEEKMPVIIDRGYKIIGGKNSQTLDLHKNLDPQVLGELIAREGLSVHPNQEKIEIYYSEIGKLVETIKKELCSVNKGGSYEVWLQIEGGISGVLNVFVSASTQTGIKAIINCHS